MTNLEIVEFKQTIISYTNQVQLPVEVKRMVFKEISEELQLLSNQEIRAEFEERQRNERLAAARNEKDRTEQVEAENA